MPRLTRVLAVLTLLLATPSLADVTYPSDGTSGSGSSTGPACQGLDDGTTCSSGGVEYTLVRGAPVPTPNGTWADLHRSLQISAGTEERRTSTVSDGLGEAFSLSMWLRVDTDLPNGFSRYPLWFIGTGSAHRIFFGVQGRDEPGYTPRVHNVKFRLTNASGTEFKNRQWRTLSLSGEWHHYVVTYDSTLSDGDDQNRDTRLYVDGVLWNADDFQAGTDVDDSDTVCGGSCSDRTIRHLTSDTAMSTHSMAAWDRVLTAREVADLYHGSWGAAAHDISDPVHSWVMCDGSATLGTATIADQGTLANMPFDGFQSGTPTCIDEMAPLPPTPIRMPVSTMTGDAPAGLVTGQGFLVGFGDSTMGSSLVNQAGDRLERSPLNFVRGGWVHQIQALGGGLCSATATLVDTWIAAGGPTQDGYSKDATTVLVKCGTNDAAATGGAAVTASESWTAIKGAIDAIEADGMKSLFVTPNPVRHTTSGCPGSSSPCDATKDAQAEKLNTFVEHYRTQALSEGVAICDVYAAYLALDDADGVEYPPSSETNMEPFFDDHQHPLYPDGSKFEGQYIEKTCLGPPPFFAASGENTVPFP